MRIALHTGNRAANPRDASWHLASRLAELLAGHASVTSLLLTGAAPFALSSPKIKRVAIGPPSALPGLGTWWYHRQLNKHFQEFRAQVVISLDLQPLKTPGIPVIQVLHPDLVPDAASWFGKKRMASRVRKSLVGQASAIAVAFPFQEELLKQAFACTMPLAAVGAVSLPAFAPMPWAARESVKAQRAAGAEFFLFFGSAANSE